MTFNPFQTPTVIDDAGVQHVLYNPTNPSGIAEPAVRDLALKAMERSVERNPKPTSTSVPAVISTVVVVGGSFFFTSPAARPWFFLAVIPVTFLLNRWLMPRAIWFETREDTLAAFLENGHCPCCAYAIGNLEREPHALLACPECGAAWKEARVGAISTVSAGMTARADSWSAMPTVKDRRGILRRLADLRIVAMKDGTFAQLAAAAAKRTRWPRIWSIVLLTGGSVALAALCVLPGMGLRALFASLGTAAPTPQPADAVINAICIAMIMWMYATWAIRLWRGYSGVAKDRVRSVILESRRCPSCLHAVTWDGRSIETTCAGCGAVWSLADVETLPEEFNERTQPRNDDHGVRPAIQTRNHSSYRFCSSCERS